ncbi:uncharacterized protein LOC143916258 [Arctopsyche grandis]|uniref:uncharacterized protein LOC143916258 n=1 Tax=Arctopsyche grandis TaxID=121162 RepID=UPI00406D99F4
MSYVSNFFRRLFNLKRSKPPSNIEERVSWLLKPYMSTVQDVLLWKNPIVSACIVVSINLMFWLVNLFEIKPFGLLGFTLLLAVILDALATTLGAGRRASRERASNRTNTNADVLTQRVTQARQWLAVTYIDMLRLREQNPSKFCFITCSSLGILYFVSNVMGALMWHALITLVLISPLAVNLQNTIASMQSEADSDGDVDEFMPVMNANVIEELHRAGEVFQDAREPVSLASGDLSLPNDVNMALLYAAGEVESSDEEDDDTTNLLSHLDKQTTPSLPSTDSSDSETEFMLKDLAKKPVAENKTTPTAKTSETPQTGGATGWLSSVFGKSQANPPSNDDSDTDEFELVDRNEL